MENRYLNWLLFITLSIIWGSSFILMKAGMNGLSSVQVASLRIVSAGMVLLPLAIRNIKKVPLKLYPAVFLSGTLGSLLPAYLFCIAEEVVDSSLAGMLNALTPIFVILTGLAFFQAQTNVRKVLGVCIAFFGCVIIFLGNATLMQDGHWGYVALIFFATISYGLNVNLVHRYLKDIPSLQIVSLAMAMIAIPAFVVLTCSHYFQKDLLGSAVVKATGFSFLLGIVGTSLANYLFYVLIKRAGTIFSSMVTYGIPFVAMLWGVIFKEQLTLLKIGGLIVILMGVYLANAPSRRGS
jgi:drug/metabolite transporter (DMT)-like permease